MQVEISLARAATETLMDVDLPPSQFAGFSDPASCPAHSTLYNLFGLQLLSTPPPPPPHYTHTVTGFPTHSTDPSFLYSLPHRRTAIPLPDCPSSRESLNNGRTQRLRKQALDQLIVPEEHYSWSCCDTSSTCLSSASLHANSMHYYNAMDRHCLRLEGCLMMDDSSESGEDGEEGEEGDSCKDELLQPGACCTREGRESDKMSESASEESKAIPPGAPPTVPGMNTNYTASLQKKCNDIEELAY